VLGVADDRLHEFARRFDPNRSPQLDPNSLRWLARQNGQIVSGTPEESSACRSRARDPNACRVAWRAPAGWLDRGPPAQRALGGRRTWDAEKRADVLLDDLARDLTSTCLHDERALGPRMTRLSPRTTPLKIGGSSRLSRVGAMIFDAYSDICARVGVSPSPSDTDFRKRNQLLKYTMTPALYLAFRFSLQGVGSSARLFCTLDSAAAVLRAVPKQAHLKQCAGHQRNAVATNPLPAM